MNWLLLAASVMVSWDPNPEPDIALYRVYVGIQSMEEGNPPLVGYTVAEGHGFVVEGLEYRTEYFFVATAVNFEGVESGYSNEVRHTPIPGKKW